MKVVNRRGFLLGLAASAAPLSAVAEHGPGLYIPARVNAGGLSVSPDGATTIVDLMTLPFGVNVLFSVVSAGRAVLDAGPLGAISPLGTRYAAIAGANGALTQATIYRINPNEFRVSGNVSATTPAKPRVRRMLILGASLGSMWCYTPALAGFRNRRLELGDGATVGMIMQATAGSAAMKTYAPASKRLHYWWDDTALRPGPLLQAAVSAIKTLPAAELPTQVHWIQGEQDSAQYVGGDDSAFTSAYYNAVLNILTIIRNTIGASLPVYIQRLGPRYDAPTGVQSMTLFLGMDLVRQAQATLVGLAGQGFYWGAQPDVAMPLRDSVHPTDWGFEMIGAMTAQAMIA